MKNNKIVILHVFIDGMNFTNTANDYDSIPGVDNLYYYYTPQKNLKLKRIKDDRVKFIRDFNEYVSYFSNPDIDVILFYALPYQHYYLFDYIDEKKYVVWWIWGYDIYNAQGNNPPLVPLKDLYKPLTKDFMTQNAKMLNIEIPFYKKWSFYKGLGYIKKRLINILGGNCDTVKLRKPQKTQDEILSRIDAAYAPLGIEIDLLKNNHPSFVADLFVKPQISMSFPHSLPEKPGNVLVNHSLTYTVNHIDVFDALKKVDLDADRKYIIPVSYGIYGYNGNPEILKSQSPLNPEQSIWLTHLLPLKEYQELFSSVTHAVFGMVRQQGLGNIFLCLRSGVKIYLFKDSVVYKELCKMGIRCFTIEEDLTTNSLSVCLDREDAENNYKIYLKEWCDNSPEKCKESLVEAISKKKNHEKRY